MNNKMTSTKNVMIILLAALVVVSIGAVSYGSSLKAEEAAPEEYVEEAVVAEEPVVDVQEIAVPAEEPEQPAEEPEQPAEEPEQPAEEAGQPAEEVEEAEEAEEAFDVEKAYEEYCKLGSDAEKEEYLNSLSAENRELLLKYIEEKEAAAAAEEAAPVEEEPAEEAEEVEDAEDKALDINIWYEFDGDFNYGTKVIWKSSVDGLKDGQAAKYQWQVDKGNGWEDIDGANADTYEMIVDAENACYTWRLVVDAE